VTPYEQKAWDQLQSWKTKELAKKDRSFLPSPVKKAVGQAGDLAETAWGKLPGHEQAELAIKKAAEGSFRAFCDLGNSAIMRDRVLQAFRDASLEVHDFDSIRKLDLREVDEVAPRLSVRYAAVSGAQGAGSGFLMGGGTAAAVGGGAATGGVGALPPMYLVVGTLVADTAALIATAFREVAHYAAYYGYDTRDPGERAFAIGILNAASAADQAAKTAAFVELRHITSLIARRATWNELNKQPFVFLLQRLYGGLHERLIKRKLAQATLALGVLLGFTINYRFIGNLGDHAFFLYRERFLREKYGLPEDTALPQPDNT
jgi:hypothetical protein